jgi:hypothetical protein
VANRNSDNISIRSGNGDGTFASAVNYSVGDSPFSVASSDFDADGDIDLAVANWESDNISILINLGGEIATLLRSFICSVNNNNIEISWTLAESGKSMDFQVYREIEGKGKFLPIETDINRLGVLSYNIVDTSCELGSRYRYRVDVTDEEGTRTLFVTETVGTETPALTLGQNYPNPFNPSTTIQYSVPERCYVTLDIFNVAGRRVDRLVDGIQKAGRHERVWGGRNHEGAILSSGVYFYELTAGKKSVTRKMILMR